MQTSIVLTGGTGTFGRFLVKEILKRPEVRLTLLVRASTQKEARMRVRKAIGGNLKGAKVLCSDLDKVNLGLSNKELTNLARDTTHILHSAASVRFTLPIDEARTYNVKTTKNVIKFAKNCPHLKRLGYVGTALVAGNRSGVIKENEFEHTSGFKNTYEQSKYEAEAFVRSQIKNLPVIIFRPPLISPGPQSSQGGTKHKNALLLGAGLVAHGDITFLPGNDASVVDVVDPTITAQYIISLLLRPSLSHMVYHITNGQNAPTVKVIRDIIEKKIQQKIQLNFCGSEEAYNNLVQSIPWYKFKKRYAHKKISSFISELAYPKKYDNSNTLDELGISQFDENPERVISQLLE